MEHPATEAANPASAGLDRLDAAGSVRLMNAEDATVPTAVARAAGVVLSMTEPKQAWTLAAAGLAPAFKTSMLQSLEKGSITEIDFINGAVVRWGQRHGVPTPVNATLVACIKGIERAMADRQREETTA